MHDFYRRFIKKDGSESHYVMAGRVVTVLLFICSSGMVFVLDTAKDAFDIILQIGAGTGLLYLVRWFWWRVNAWCEVVAMVSSFAISLVFLLLAKNDVHISTHVALMATVAFTSLCWIVTAFVGPETDRATLVSFYNRVRPFGPGWAKVRKDAGLPVHTAQSAGENIPLALLGWFAGCIVIWSSLFTVGNVLYGKMSLAAMLFAVFIVSGTALIYVVRRLWTDAPASR